MEGPEYSGSGVGHIHHGWHILLPSSHDTRTKTGQCSLLQKERRKGKWAWSPSYLLWALGKGSPWQWSPRADLSTSQRSRPPHRHFGVRSLTREFGGNTYSSLRLRQAVFRLLPRFAESSEHDLPALPRGRIAITSYICRELPWLSELSSRISFCFCLGTPPGELLTTWLIRKVRLKNFKWWLHGLTVGKWQGWNGTLNFWFQPSFLFCILLSTKPQNIPSDIPCCPFGNSVASAWLSASSSVWHL